MVGRAEFRLSIVIEVVSFLRDLTAESSKSFVLLAADTADRTTHHLDALLREVTEEAKWTHLMGSTWKFVLSA